MPIQVVGAVAGATARGAVAGTRVVGRGAVKATTVTARMARQGIEKTSSAVTKTASSTARGVSNGVRVANNAVEESGQAGYRAGRFVSRAVREESKKKQDDALRVHYGTPTRVGSIRTGVRRMIGSGGHMTPSSLMGQRNTVKQARTFANHQQSKKTPRISKSEGRVMIATAILFDLLPLLLIIGPAVAFFATAGEGPDCSWYDAYCKAMNITEGVAGAAAIVAILALSPMIYAAGSVISVVLGLLIFGVWFMFKGVSPVSLAFFMIFESIPVVNILPMFTVGVWRCVTGVAREDAQQSSFSNQPITT